MVDTKGFSVYPNPTNDVVNIVFERSANTNSRVELLSMTGQVMISQVIPNGTVNLTLSVANYPNGAYFLRVVDASQRLAVQKITIMH